MPHVHMSLITPPSLAELCDRSCRSVCEQELTNALTDVDQRDKGRPARSDQFLVLIRIWVWI